MFRNAFRNALCMCVKHRDPDPQKARFPTREIKHDKGLAISKRRSTTDRETSALVAQDAYLQGAFA